MPGTIEDYGLIGDLQTDGALVLDDASGHGMVLAEKAERWRTG
jgi:hypothetical protein